MNNTYCCRYTLGVTEKLEIFKPLTCLFGIRLVNFCGFVSLAVLDEHNFQNFRAVSCKSLQTLPGHLPLLVWKLTVSDGFDET